MNKYNGGAFIDMSLHDTYRKLCNELRHFEQEIETITEELEKRGEKLRPTTEEPDHDHVWRVWTHL